MKENSIQICVNCVMDTSDPEIVFDEQGVCDYCKDYKVVHAQRVFEGYEGARLLQEEIAKIKGDGKNKKYDCIMGISGGVDSTYVAYLAKQHGLRPLAVHLDNGWNSELAAKNLANIIRRLGFDLHTHVIDWEEFKDLQLAYLKASVIDIEAITDHAVFSALYKLAAEHKVKHLLVGLNVVTEAILPRAWITAKMDGANIADIHKQFGTKPLKTFPLMDIWLKQYYLNVLKIKKVRILNYVPYIKEDAQATIIKKLKWRDYGGKHYESVFTRFYQGYILPEKFKVDKRIAHLSTLICSGQITREQALEELKTPPYDAEQLKIDKEFVLKKFELSEGEFDEIMNLPIRKHEDFKTEGTIYKHYPIFKPLKPIIDLIKGNKRTIPDSKTNKI